MRVEEVESTHSLVRDSHLVGREAAAVEGLTVVEEGEVAPFHVVGDHVDLVEWEEAQDPVRFDFLPLFRQTRCLDRDRWTGELVGMNPHFVEDHRCLEREDSHLSSQVRGVVARSLRRTCEVSISTSTIGLRFLTSASRPSVSAP